MGKTAELAKYAALLHDAHLLELRVHLTLDALMTHERAAVVAAQRALQRALRMNMCLVVNHLMFTQNYFVVKLTPFTLNIRGCGRSSVASSAVAERSDRSTTAS